MEEYKQITLDEWMQWKEDIRRKLAETAGNFVYIGYRLKQIRDSGMYDGAADIFEFAGKEYGLGKSTVSRFIAINEKYSEGGNSLELKEEFRGFSSSKLAEMLTLPDSEVELITEKTTIREIRELKAFNNQDQGESEEAAAVQPVERTPLEKCLLDFFKDRKEMLNGIIRCLEADPPAYKEAAELMAPSQTSHRKGIVFLFLYDWSTGIKYKLMTDTDPVSMSWTELLDLVYDIFTDCGQADVWEAFYGEPEGIQEEGKEEPEKPVSSESNQGFAAVATSQQEEEKEPVEKQTEAPQKEPEKEEKLQPEPRQAEPEETVPEPEKQETEEEKTEERKPEEQEAAGIEDEKNEETETACEAVKNHGQAGEHTADSESGHEEIGTGEGAGTDLGDEENALKLQYGKLSIRNALGSIERYVDRENWEGIIGKAQEIIKTAKEVIKLTEEA